MAGIQVGRRYKRRGGGSPVTIKSTLSRSDTDYKEGFRFLGSTGFTYKPNGRYSSEEVLSPEDLVELLD